MIGLTQEEQWKKMAEPDLTLTELLGLTLCTGYIQTTLQTLDRIYINQHSRFLPLAQEAKKLKEEQEASLWVGIPPEKTFGQVIHQTT